VNVAVAVYVPVWYCGSFVSVQATEFPPVPNAVERASAPKEATPVAEPVAAVSVPAQPVAGATAVQVGTANFVDPFIWPKLIDGISDYMRRHQIARVADLVGTLDTAAGDKEWTAS